MFPEFGQAPLCLELDLDSYDDSWTHVATFRGQSGWLLMARATIQSEHDLLRARLIAACDEQDNPIPAWRAVYLTQCRWNRLDHCTEEPPGILDDLMCEEEGAFYARWQREMNADLAALYDNGQRAIESLEARATARAREVDAQIADLRRRRRLLDATDDAYATLTEIVAELESQADQEMAQLAQRRAALRRNAEATEEALWQRTDVLIEVEPMCLVRWRGHSIHTSRDLLAPEHAGSGGISLQRVHRSDLRALERRRAKEALERARQAEAARADALARQADNEERKMASATSVPNGAPSKPASADLPKASPIFRRLAAAKAQPTPPVNAPPLQSTPVASETPRPYGKLDIERDLLAGMLEGLEEKGRKFFAGSPKYRRNVEERADLVRQIADLDAQIAEMDGERSIENPANWTPDEIATLRKAWASGHSARQIAEMLGRFSRNAVIGKAKRLGLPMRAQPDVSARQFPPNELTADS